MDILVTTVLVGAGATATTDLWALLRRRLFGTPLPNWAFVGRWLGHMRRGRFRHASIARATPLAREAAIGWIAHYAIGIAFAALLPWLWGAHWLQAPTVLPAMLVGLATVLAPFLLMQPGMGAGLFARRTPRPASARLQSLVTHAVFGIGLYASALALQIPAGS